MAAAAFITIAVFGLFHPRQLSIEAWEHEHLQITCGNTERRIEGRLSFPLKAGCELKTSSDFVLNVPGKIRRHFRGSLKVFPGASHAELVPVIAMALEDAVASAVQAEAPVGATQTMLEVQAIICRSFYQATQIPRHPHSAFCDTTHCQFLKDPPSPKHPAAGAARITKSQTIQFNGRTVQTYYAARCNGQLKPLPPERLQPGEYPYYFVRCEFCLRKPAPAIPKSNARPHLHGLCQLGADDLSRQGLTSNQILAHYFPGTEVHAMP